jgi:hypothetical protein
MKIQELVKNAGSLTDSQFAEKLRSLLMGNFYYQKINSDNKKIIFDLFKKNKDFFLKGKGMPYEKRAHEIYNLEKNKQDLKLSTDDLTYMKQIINTLGQ